MIYRKVRTIVLTGMCVVLCAGMGACSQNDRQQAHNNDEDWRAVRSRMKREVARQQLKAGELERAQHTLLEAMDLNDGDAETVTMLLQTHLAADDLTSAKSLVDEYRQTMDEHAPFVYLAAVLDQRTGKTYEAMLGYQAATDIDPRSFVYARAYVETLVLLNEAGQAAAWLRSRNDVLQEHASYDGLLAAVYESMGMPERAVDVYLAAVRSNSDNLVMWQSLANCCLESQRYDVCLEAVRRIIELQGRADVDVLITKAQCLVGLERYDQAERILGPMIRDMPDNAYPWMLLIRSAACRGQYERAYRLACRAGDRFDDQIDIHLLAMGLAMKTGRPDETISRAHDWLARHGDDQTVRSLLTAAERLAANPDRDGRVRQVSHDTQ